VEHGEGHGAVVVRSLGIVEDRRDLAQVLFAQVEGDVAEALLGDQRQRLGRDLEDFVSLKL